MEKFVSRVGVGERGGAYTEVTPQGVDAGREWEPGGGRGLNNVFEKRCTCLQVRLEE